ncbi:MAG TPA: hypothetical protein VNT22_06485, partial [Baekduia sp.]|nr:hypothetical protein [Baekduia sp.]
MSSWSADTFESLFAPTSIASVEVRNRWVMAPMTRKFSPGGIATAEVASYYARRAGGGVGLIISEGTYVPHPAAAEHPDVPRLDGDEALAGWRLATDAVHDAGGRIFAQLWHAGALRGDRPSIHPAVASVSPSGVDVGLQPVGRAMTAADIDEARVAYVQGALNARSAGFDGVEIHGAHGYLPDLFFWDRTNQRTDAYGGSLEARSRFAAEVVAAIRAAVGPHYPIAFRFSQWKVFQYTARIAQSPAELETILRSLAEAGADLLDVSTRRHWLPAFPELSGSDGQRSLAGWAKQVSGLPVITVGSIGLDNDFTIGAEYKDLSTGTDLARLAAQLEHEDPD